MNKLSILLLLLISPWATVLCDCQLKENARDLLYVGYSNYFNADGKLNYTDIDKIEVRMKEEKNNFGLWLFKDGCSEKTKKTTKLSTKLYKRRESEEIEVRKETRRAGVVEFEDLDPCAVYIVSVTIGKHKVGRYKVGPYYSQDDVQNPLLNNDPGWQKLASFRQVQKMPSILSSDAYLLIYDKKTFFCAHFQNLWTLSL